GFGRAATTGLGVVAGAAIGNSVETNAANSYPPAVVPVQRCSTVSSYENRVVGYDVVYEYSGQRYSTRMATDPGDRLAIDVRPGRRGDVLTSSAPDYAESPPPDAGYGPPPRTVYTPLASYGPNAVYETGPTYAPVPLIAPPVVYIGTSPGYYYSGGWGPRGRHWR
ncbi:MAG: hypothetical protein ABIV63_21285, partial [Caldimonas sp.]